MCKWNLFLPKWGKQEEAVGEERFWSPLSVLSLSLLIGLRARVGSVLGPRMELKTKDLSVETKVK